MLFDCDCKDALERLGDRPKIFKFNFIPNGIHAYIQIIFVLEKHFVYYLVIAQ